MPKYGIYHDYDLHANLEKTAQEQTCAICDTQFMRFQWSDYSGEGMCTRCGCPYQLKWGTNEQKAEGNYPYMTLRDDVVPIAREYWRETGNFVYYGTSMGRKPGMREFVQWCKKNHPEILEKKS